MAIKVDAVIIELEYNYFVEPFLYRAYDDEPEILVNTIAVRYVAEQNEGLEMVIAPLKGVEVKLVGNRVLKGGKKAKRTDWEWLSYSRLEKLNDTHLRDVLTATLRNGHRNFTKFVN